ncbi:serine/threonine-protein kinase ATR, partial [Asbolus verrucosus]
MSLTDEIPAFSIWETFSETIPALMSTRPSEKSVEHLAKIIKSGDFSNIFVYNRDSSQSFKSHQKITDKYKCFTTWFLGRFFYLLSCEKLSKSHSIYVDIQLCILDQLSKTQLHVFVAMAQEYSDALASLTAFIKSSDNDLELNVFIPAKNEDLNERLNLTPVSIEINKKNCEDFLLKLFKFIRYILNQNFDFQNFDAVTSRNLDDLLFLLSTSSFAIKLEILSIYLELVKKIEWKSDCDCVITHKMDLFALFFEQTIYGVYSQKFQAAPKKIEEFEALLTQFLELNEHNEKFLKINYFLLNKGLDCDELIPSQNIQKMCKKMRKKPLFGSRDFPDCVRCALANYNTSILCGLKTEIINDISNYRHENEGGQEVKVYVIPGKWSIFHQQFSKNLDDFDCKRSCLVRQFLEFFIELTRVLIEVRIDLKNSIKIGFFEEVIFVKTLTVLNQHLNNCEEGRFDDCNIFNLFLNFSFISNAWTLSTFFDIFAFAITKSTISQNSALRAVDNGRYKKEMSDFFKSITNTTLTPNAIFEFLNRFLTRISSGLFEPRQIHDMEMAYLKICKQFMDSQNAQVQAEIIKNLPNVLTLFNNSETIISQILIPALSSSDQLILKQVTKILPQIICITASDFIKLIRMDPEDGELTIDIHCDKCHLSAEAKSVSKSNKIDEFTKNFQCSTVSVSFSKIDLDLPSLTGMILKNLLKFLTFNDAELKLLALEVLPFCSNHILKFYSGNVAKIWVGKCEDQDETVRRKFGEIVAKILKYGQENEVLSNAIKAEVMDILFATLTKLTKKSLQQSDYKLQETILHTVQEICNIKLENTILPIVKILIYLIMVPTSKHSLIAVNKFFVLAEKHNTTTSEIYKQYKQEICEIIVHLCAVNQALLKYPLSTSLCKISVTLEFYNSKNFVLRECQYLLPFFVSKIIRMEAVGKLIEEVALMVNLNLADLLASIYGNIFLHVFLNESKDDFKQSMLYLERTTGLSGSALRKRNLWVILNELLLNFHDKKDKVLLALRLLSTEEGENNFNSVQDYLQSRFLGLLQHFDFKLMTKNNNKKSTVLLSLADLFKYMGPKHIGPLRFKIIAMLRTADCGGFPELNCEVWNAFIRSCDVESLGPQLATIFVSILPLIRTCPKQINDIFKYLVIDNERSTNEFIKDLFFIDDPKIDNSVVLVIKKHLKSFEDCSFKDKMKLFLKYVSHETLEVRVRSLKHLKLLMEKNREELDQMILGYNGIDPVIVELIDILTSGCREKDADLKLACGEVIGELGAVEPSHLPRRYAQNSRNFTFFINDDAFIVNALNELTKALQGEKNTVNMDRFAVAIQEILKNYEIAPEESSSRNRLWKQFPEWQQELMLPLLKSRYIIAQAPEASYSSPIYGTSVGASFHSWIYHWTLSLISTLPEENQSVLSPCLPAMKQDHRILMQFLPHILLHSIIEGSNDSKEKSYNEIKTVTSSFVKKKKIDPKLLDVRPVPVPNVPPTIEPVTPEEVKQTQCTKVVFIILDFLDRWTREWQWQKGLAGRTDENFANIKDFLGRFCKLQLAKCNYHCGEYPRALMYLEDYITDNPNEMSNHLSFLAEIYAQLDEPDGVEGVTAVQQSEPSIEQRILAHEVSGKLSDAAACYERIAQPLKLHHIQGLIQCYLDLDNVNTALNFAQGALNRRPEFGNMLLEMQAEPLWRLGRYEELDTLLKKPEMADNPAWGVQIGKALLSFQNQDRRLFATTLEKLKSQQMELLGAASLEEGSYQHGYCYISRLHALNELYQVEKATYEMLLKPNDNTFVESVISHLAKEWELRIKVVQESVRIVEPLLCLRRVAVEQSKRIIERRVPNAIPLLNSLLGECWLLSANTARAAGIHQQAYTYTLKAEEFAPPRLFLEKAKLHWLREEHEQALRTLRRGLEIILPESSSQAINALSLEKRKLCCEAKLLIASYNDSISNVDTDIKTSHYKESIDVYKEWEKNWVCFGQFHDRNFQNRSDEERDNTRGSEMQLLIINTFLKSLLYGTTFVYQSMPRLLSIWFDYGTRLLDVTQAPVREERRNNLVRMSKLIDSYLERLPAYVFLTAFSQIVSRICHPQKEVYILIKAIIVKLLLHYPQQSLWMMISVMKSSYAVRAKRCAEIFADKELKTATMTKLVRDFTNLAEKLIELCNKDLPSDVETATVSTLLRALPRMLNKSDFSEIMIPTHKFRKLVLPNPDFSSGQHNPFPNHYVHIVGIDEEITVLRSLQRPRKITFRGSDGKGYIQMLKPKDDLRKDFRLMEFNDIVNQLLSREPEARQRRLNIRLYSVSPLNEECGLIEWVPNLLGLRPIILSLYKQRGIAVKLSKDMTRKEDPLAKKREFFTKVLLQRYPPVLGEWFRRTFPDAQSWVFARTAYIRTTAVISMVGYILGLGDRHGENILLDSICGDTVHVDFNCLFNKGETFEWPERVPFRLTQNMVAAMGPLGVEGVFRKSCACTLRVLRTNSNTLMSIVTPFVYDPLVSWPRNVPASMSSPAERTNEQALDHIKNIQLRLQGIILKTSDKTRSIPLSVDGQTIYLMNEAMNIDNLCQMYSGWGAYL